MIPVNHMAGHLMAASLVDTIEYPAMALLVSGGHSELVYVEKEGSYKKLVKLVTMLPVKLMIKLVE